jgi:hypothetical protein
MSCRINCWLAQFNCTVHHARKRHDFLTELELPLRDARDIEQIVDDPHHVVDLPIRHLQLCVRLGRLAARAPHQLDRESHRRERIPELVRQDAEKFVLAPIDLPQRLGVDAQRLGGGAVVTSSIASNNVVGRSDRTIGVAFSTNTRCPRSWR